MFWEVDPTALTRDDHFADPEFEKEAWLSMVMLEWGTCGQIAVPVRPAGEQQDVPVTEQVDAACIGYDVVLLEDCAATTSPTYCFDATVYNVAQCFGFVTTSTALLDGER